MPKGQTPPVPQITVQLVHIEGPLKGQIQEFDDPLITIGRSPDCSVTFPKELKAISRKHAEIRREGNRFKLIDHSTNGTFIQGRRVDEAYLKDGDVITFTENGPKASFLSMVQEVQEQAHERPAPTKSPESQNITPPPPQRGPVTITVQWGPALKTFRQPSIRIGSDPSCELSTDIPGISPYHLEIKDEQGNIWVKDLTGESKTVLNGMPLTQSTVLRTGDSLRLTASGPILEYMGEARFVRKEIPRIETPSMESQVREAPSQGFQTGIPSGTGTPKTAPLRNMPGLPAGVPLWIWIAGGSTLLVALIVYLIVKLTS